MLCYVFNSRLAISERMAEYCDLGWSPVKLNISTNLPIESESVTIDTEKAVSDIRKLCSSRPDIGFSRTDDAYLLRFLYAQKFNVQKSFELMLNYYMYQQRNQHIFENMSPEDVLVQMALRDGLPGVLSQRDRRGRCVIVIFAANWDHYSYSLEVIYKALWLTMERLISKVRNQANGFVMLVDWSEFSLRQSSNLSPRILKLIVEGLQDCFPARFKGIHFISQPWFVEAALAIIRPFLKEKTKDKIFLHGNNLSTLHSHVTKDILPAELGGEGPSYDPRIWAEEISCCNNSSK